jgi:hypothetical protein
VTRTIGKLEIVILVDLAKIQYTRDGEGPDQSYEKTLTNIDNELYCYFN